MEAGGTAGEVILRVEGSAILLKYGVGKGCGDRLISIVFLFVIKVI